MTYRKKRYSSRAKKGNYHRKSDVDKFIQLVLGLSVLTYFTYMRYIKPNIDNIIFYLEIFIPIIIIIIGLIFYYFHKKRKKEEHEYLEQFPIWLVNLENKIKEFKPLRNYSEEKMYQVELAGFLKNNYPDLDIEQSKDYSRPDIVIDNIAIEIKGPTTMAGLKSIPDKINSYIPKWDYLYIVLFNVSIVDDEEENNRIYIQKKQEILDNIAESKKDKVFIIEIN